MILALGDDCVCIFLPILSMWWCEMWVENKKADSRFIYIFRFFWLREMMSFLKERLERQKMDWKRDVGTFIFRKEQNRS